MSYLREVREALKSAYFSLDATILVSKLFGLALAAEYLCDYKPPRPDVDTPDKLLRFWIENDVTLFGRRVQITNDVDRVEIIR